MTIKVIGLREVQTRLRRVPGLLDAAQRAVVTQGIFLASKMLKQATVSQIGGSHPFWGKLSPKIGPFLRGRSGMTSRRITPGLVTRRGSTYEGRVGSPDQHVRFHEEGGVIPFDFPGYRMSPAGYLRIPTVHAQTAGGSDRWGNQSIRAIPGAFLLKSKAGKLWAAMRDGQVLKLLYLLARRSPTFGRHRPRRIFDRTRTEVQKAMAAHADQLVKQAVARG